MKNTIEITVRVFPVLSHDHRTDDEKAITVTVTRQQLQAAQVVGQSSKELIERLCGRQGYSVIETGKPDKLSLTVDLDKLLEEREEQVKRNSLYEALTNDLVEAVITAGNNVVPRIQEIAERALELGPYLVHGFSEIIPEFARMGGEIVQTLADGFSAQVPALLEFGSKAVGAIADGIRTNGAVVGNSITWFLTDVIDMIGSQSSRLIEAGVVIKNSIFPPFWRS